MDNWSRPLNVRVHRTLRCKCGAILASGYVEYEAAGAPIPTETVEYVLCPKCLEELACHAN